LGAKKSFTRDAATDNSAASLLPVVAVWQWRKVRGNVCFFAKFHTSSLSQYNDVFMLAVKHD